MENKVFKFTYNKETRLTVVTGVNDKLGNFSGFDFTRDGYRTFKRSKVKDLESVPFLFLPTNKDGKKYMQKGSKVFTKNNKDTWIVNVK